MRKTLTIQPNLENLMKKRYYQPDESTPQQMIRRVADFVAQGEKKYGWSDQDISHLADDYYEIFNNRLAIPSSPFLMNAGTKTPMLFACFVVGGLKDNLPSIYKTLERQGNINKLGGGTGFNFSTLREEGASIDSTGGTSSGVMTFMDLFNENGGVIKQGGKRRTANMGVLNYDHPEIMKFIEYKKDRDKLQNFNISVLVDDYFMDAVHFDSEVELVSPKNNEVVGRVKARELWDKLMYNAWENGEPAVLFKDNMNADNPMLFHLGDIVTTNPCGEIVLYEFEACDLASINLEEFIDWDGVVDWASLKSVIQKMIRFLDTAIDVNMYPEDIIEETVKSLRRLGLGVMGLHGALIKAGYQYNSQEGRAFAKELMEYINKTSYFASQSLAEEKGVFPLWDKSSYIAGDVKIRNVARTTIAPTGTIQQIVDSSSSGCEPIFALAYKRIVDDETIFVTNPLFEEHAKIHGYWSDDLPELIYKNKGRAKGVDNIPEAYQNLFETAMEITPSGHVLMQAVLQEHVDNSISKTINLPSDATLEAVSDAYMLGWELGLKGMTVYRDGSRSGQVLSVGGEDEHGVQELARGDIKVAPKTSAHSKTVRLDTGCGTMYLTMTKDENGNVDQTFVSKGANGTCLSNQTAVSRLMSLSLRGGIHLDKVIDQLQSVPVCPSYYGKKKAGGYVSKGSSCPSAIAHELRVYSNEMFESNSFLDLDKEIIRENIELGVPFSIDKNDKCPECGELMEFEGGCVSCKSCGYSKCD